MNDQILNGNEEMRKKQNEKFITTGIKAVWGARVLVQKDAVRIEVSLGCSHVDRQPRVLAMQLDSGVGRLARPDTAISRLQGALRRLLRAPAEILLRRSNTPPIPVGRYLLQPQRKSTTNSVQALSIVPRCHNVCQRIADPLLDYLLIK